MARRIEDTIFVNSHTLHDRSAPHSGGAVQFKVTIPVIVPPSDFLGLAEAMKTLLENPGERERLARAGRARAEAEYDSRKQADRLLAAYESLMK